MLGDIENMRYKNGDPKKASRFICLRCLQENKIGLGIQRRGKQREKNHVKSMWCIHCQEFDATYNLEVRYCDTFDDKMKQAVKIRSKYYSDDIL